MKPQITTPQPPRRLSKLDLRLDPERALEPMRRSLTSLDAQRVINVFDDTINRLKIVTLLPFLLNNLDRFHVLLGIDIVELLKHHDVVIDSYDEISKQLDTLLDRRAKKSKERKHQIAGGTERVEVQNGDSDATDGLQLRQNSDTRINAALNNLFLVAQQLSHSIRNVLRAFSIYPDIMMRIKGDITLSTQDFQVLMQNMTDLRTILMNRLLTSPEEEQEKMAYLAEIAKRERQHALVTERLEEELKETVEDKDEAILKKNNIIKRLQNEVLLTQKHSDEQTRRIRADAEKQEASDEQVSEEKCQLLRNDIVHLQSQLRSLIEEHKANELALRQKKFKVETAVEGWIQKYDAELDTRQDEFEEIDAVYTEEKKQLQELEERFAILEKEYKHILDERVIAVDKRKKEERLQACLESAATIIQAQWRSYKVRKVLNQRRRKREKQMQKAKGKN